MKKSYLNKIGKHPVSQAKRRIQELLREYVLLRDKKCVICAAHGKDSRGRVMQADHIFSRAIAATFSNLDNVILICQPCHGFWKPAHPLEYSEIIKEKLGKKKYEKLKYLSQTTLHMTARDWELEEKRLKQEIDKLKR
ncbi:HNH endonuclease [Patescibacteria group bacterium]|nr:HNH endonuclease [Patescibacteria group bacterium]